MWNIEPCRTQAGPRVVMPVYATSKERRGSRKSCAAAPRKRIQRRNRWLTLGVGGGATRLVQVVGNQLPDAWPVTFDVLGHLADGGPVVIHDSGTATNHGVVGRTIGEPNARTDIGIGVVGNVAPRINHNVWRESSRGKAGLGCGIASHSIPLGVQHNARDAGNMS